MENQETDINEVAQQIYAYATNLMINQKKSPGEAKRILMDQGLNQEQASVVINNLSKQIKQAKQSKANKNMLYGALWCVGGTVVTAATYSAASGGGKYVIAWGAIIFGAAQFIKGLVDYMSLKKYDNIGQ